MSPNTIQPCVSIRELMARHFDPDWGSPYWVEKRAHLSFDPIEEIKTLEDLTRFGPFCEEDLREVSSIRFVPKRDRDRLGDWVQSETGGTTGPPKRVYFSPEEFRAGFIDPFLLVCRKIGWPRGGGWLYLGPSGPHAIGKVVDPICKALGSPPAFRIDFDPRWSLRLALGSVARARYLEHLVDQAVNIVEKERVEILFGTPAILERLAERLPVEIRNSIRAVHYGGTALSSEKYLEFRSRHFPNAIHLSGYGNSLVGVAFEASTEEDERLSYYPTANRHQIRVVATNEEGHGVDLESDVPFGETGWIVVSRLDETCFIPNLVERDQGISVGPTAASASLGWNDAGVHNPQPVPNPDSTKAGLY